MSGDRMASLPIAELFGNWNGFYMYSHHIGLKVVIAYLCLIRPFLLVIALEDASICIYDII
jgi:hypothetical protein